jgi:hypothetical protein
VAQQYVRSGIHQQLVQQQHPNSTCSNFQRFLRKKQQQRQQQHQWVAGQ